MNDRDFEPIVPLMYYDMENKENQIIKNLRRQI